MRITVFDIECTNEVCGKMQISGRQPNFAAIAAKLFIRECSVIWDTSAPLDSARCSLLCAYDYCVLC